MAFEPKSVVVTDDYITKYGNEEILVDTSTKPITITLVPIGNGVQQADKGYPALIKDVGYNASKNNINIISTGTDKVDNTTSFIIDSDGGFLKLNSDGVNNWIDTGDSKLNKARQFIILPTPDIDGKTTGTTNIVNIPLSKQIVFSGIDIGIKSLTGTVTGFGEAKIQTDAGVDLSPSVIFTGLNAVGKLITIPPLGLLSGVGRIVVGGAGGTKIQFNLTTAFTVGTSITLTGFVKGYFLN